MKIDKRAMRLYAVTDRRWLSEGETLTEYLEAVLKAGVTCVQLREKNSSKEEMLREARAVQPLCAAYHVPFIINDDVETAKAVDADGVHVGQEDTSVLEARAVLGPGKIIGASAHNVEEARRAAEQGADYLGVGAVFGSSTKQDASYLPMETLKEIRRAVDLPIVAIGGITEANILNLSGSGADGAAVISALFAQKDETGKITPQSAAAAARRLRKLSEEMAVSNGKTKRIRAALFDVDGTLTDSMYIWESADEMLLKQHHIAPPPWLKEELDALTLRQTAVFFNERFGLHETPEETMDEICKIVEEEYFYKVQGKPHVESVLSWLSSKGVALGIVTASERYHVEAACKRLGIWKYFQEMFTCTETGLTKHTPEIFERAAAKLGALPQETIVFEDALHAVKTAADNGFWTAAVDDTFNQKYSRELKETADWFLKDYSQVEKILNGFI